MLSFHRLLAKDELVAILQKCEIILNSSKTKKMEAALGQLQNYLAKFDQLDSMFALTLCYFSGILYQMHVRNCSPLFTCSPPYLLDLSAEELMQEAVSPEKDLHKKTDLFQLQKVNHNVYLILG